MTRNEILIHEFNRDSFSNQVFRLLSKGHQLITAYTSTRHTKMGSCVAYTAIFKE